MRDIVILTGILVVIPFCFKKPFFGVLMWAVVSYLNPHRYAYANMVYNFPIGIMVAIPTLLGMIFAPKFNREIFSREGVLLLALWIWMGASLLYATQVPLFAGHIAEGTSHYIQITKILLMTLVTVLLVTTKERLRQLVLVIALCLGLRAVWAGIFGIETGGDRVYGPHDSFLEDNNDFALGLNMTLPMLYFLIPGEPKRWARIGLWICFLASILCVILTYSRGGFLGLATVLLLIAIMSRYRVLALAFVAVIALTIVSFAPPKWTDRMDRLFHGEIDSSAKQRLVGWGTGWNLVKDHPIFGGGLDAYPDVVVFRHYQPEPMPGGRASEGPHSIYFQVLGELGFVGFALFIFLLGSCVVSLHRLRSAARRRSRSHWVIPYTRMFEVSLAGFMVSGAFLGRAYFDLWYEIVACLIVLKVLYKREVNDPQEDNQATNAECVEAQLTVPV